MAKEKTNSVYVATYPIKFNKPDMDMMNRLMRQCVLLQNTLNNKMFNVYDYVTSSKEYRKIESDYAICNGDDKSLITDDNIIVNIINEYKGKIDKKKAYVLARERFFKSYETDYKGERGNILKLKPFTEYGILAYSGKYKKQYPLLNSMSANYVGKCVHMQWSKMIENPETEIKFKSSRFIDKASVSFSKSGGKLIGITLSNDMRHINVKVGKHIVNGEIIIRNSEYNTYVIDAFNKGNVKIVKIVKSQVRGKDYYEVQFSIDGVPYNKMRNIGTGKVGIDLGVSTVAAYGTGELEMLTLNTETTDMYLEKKAKIQQAMDQSRRATNPDNYNEDGTIKKLPDGQKLRWKCSKHYLELKKQNAELERLRAYHRKQHHNSIANRLIEMGDTFIIEDNNIKAMKKRAKETTVNEKTGKINSKKRLGKSIGNNAPSQLVSILENKVKALGGTFKKVSCKGASTQFDFTDQSFTKRECKERNVVLSNGNTHTRDGIAAFNIKHRIDPGKKNIKVTDNYDIDAMTKDYESFVVAEQNEIARHISGEKNTTWVMGIKKCC